ncbi:MAG: hypothetical protein ACXWKM_10350, partial [Phenylobacterium sp.]
MHARLIALPLAFLLAGCGGFVHDERLADEYRLVAVDIPEDMEACRRLPGNSHDCVADGLPGPTVFAAGADRRFLVIA